MFICIGLINIFKKMNHAQVNIGGLLNDLTGSSLVLQNVQGDAFRLIVADESESTTLQLLVQAYINSAWVTICTFDSQYSF
jgi:hypothetical protein